MLIPMRLLYLKPVWARSLSSDPAKSPSGPHFGGELFSTAAGPVGPNFACLLGTYRVASALLYLLEIT